MGSWLIWVNSGTGLIWNKDNIVTWIHPPPPLSTLNTFSWYFGFSINSFSHIPVVLLFLPPQQQQPLCSWAHVNVTTTLSRHKCRTAKSWDVANGSQMLLIFVKSEANHSSDTSSSFSVFSCEIPLSTSVSHAVRRGASDTCWILLLNPVVRTSNVNSLTSDVKKLKAAHLTT